MWIQLRCQIYADIHENKKKSLEIQLGFFIFEIAYVYKIFLFLFLLYLLYNSSSRLELFEKPNI